MTEHWSIGWLVGMPVWIVLSTLLGIAALSAFAWGEDAFEKVGGFAFIGALWALVFFVGLGLLWPLQTPYHKFIPHGGTVAEVNSRLVPVGKSSMEQKIVILFKDDPQEYGCTDTRCSLAKPGDHVDLSCIKAWVWAGTDGFDCNFVKRVPA